MRAEVNGAPASEAVIRRAAGGQLLLVATVGPAAGRLRAGDTVRISLTSERGTSQVEGVITDPPEAGVSSRVEYTFRLEEADRVSDDLGIDVSQ